MAARGDRLQLIADGAELRRGALNGRALTYLEQGANDTASRRGWRPPVRGGGATNRFSSRPRRRSTCGFASMIAPHGEDEIIRHVRRLIECAVASAPGGDVSLLSKMRLSGQHQQADDGEDLGPLWRPASSSNPSMEGHSTSCTELSLRQR